MAMLLTKREKNVMLQLENASRSVLAHFKKGSENKILLKNKLQRLEDAVEKFDNTFNL